MRKRLISLGALATAIAALVLASPASASHGQLTFFDASNQLSGQYGPGQRTRALNELQALGTDVVRFQVYWRNIAPGADSTTPPAGFDPRNPLTYGTGGANWNGVDEVVKGAADRGMKVALVLSGAPPTGRVPLWASLDAGGSQSDPSPGAFEDFAYAVGKRYGGGPGSVGDVAYVSLWNEPNSPTFLRGKNGQGAARVIALYRRLIVAGASGLDAAGYPGQTIAGEVGPIAKDRRRDPRNFTRAVLCLSGRGKGACPRLDIDGWSHHPYLFSRAPFLKPFGGRQVSFANLRSIQKIVRRAQRVGTLSRSARFYVTEFGFPTRPDAPIGVTRRQQAEYDAIAEYLAYNNPGLSSFAQYLLRDDPRGSLAYGFASGLCPAGTTDSHPPGEGFGCKPSYGAFRTPLVARARSQRRATIWGYVRPATGATTVTVIFRDRGGRAQVLRTLRTNAGGYFQFGAANKPGRQWSLHWNGFKGPLVRAYGF